MRETIAQHPSQSTTLSCTYRLVSPLETNMLPLRFYPKFLLGPSPVLVRSRLSFSHRIPVRATTGFHSASKSSPSWSFPQPPDPPSMEQLQEKGLPILHQASIHALEDRILLSGWKNDSDGTVETASYKQVLSRASNVSQWILQSRKDSDKAARKLVAHLNVPGWEYVASQWGKKHSEA